MKRKFIDGLSFHVITKFLVMRQTKREGERKKNAIYYRKIIGMFGAVNAMYVCVCVFVFM